MSPHPPPLPTSAAGVDYARTVEPLARPAGRMRWVVCGLLFFATTVNYIDRQVIGILAPRLKSELGWSKIDYSNIVFAFQIAYALGLLLAGGLIDRLGTRLGYALALVVWSGAAVAHAAVRSVFGFQAVRFVLGLGEAGNFPAAIKTVAVWFPKRERALATGIFNAGSNVGAILAPLAVPWIADHWSWQWAFVLTGAFGFLWLALWLPVYRPPQEHPSVSLAELAWIRSDPPEPAERIPWARLLPHRQTWAFAVAKFLTDPIWWFYLYWTGLFLDEKFGISLSRLSGPLVVIYLVADVGSIGGGWLSSLFLRRGWTANAARKTAMLACALCVAPVCLAPLASNLWAAVGLISVAAAAHQGWSANLFTLASDMFPRRAVGSVVGIGGMAGAVGGMILAKVVGYVTQGTGSYFPIFIVCGSGYLVALGLVQLLAPNLEPAPVEREGGMKEKG